MLEQFNNKVICGDCLEVMKGIPDKSIDMVLTSPPYDNLRTYNGYTFDFEGIAKELYRIVKDGGVVVWVVGDATIKGSETGTSFRQALFFNEIGFECKRCSESCCFFQEQEYKSKFDDIEPSTAEYVEEVL